MSSVLEHSAAAEVAKARAAAPAAAVERPAADPPEANVGGFGLPRFATQEQGALFVDVARIESPEHFTHFVQRVFDDGFLFNQLDYANFQRALHVGGTPAGAAVRKLRLASGIAPFLPLRRSLYKTVKITGQGADEQAEYMFEPCALEKTVEVTVDVPADEPGGEPTTRQELQKLVEPATLDFDEFVADMWDKGVRFGIDAAEVKKAIAKRETARLVIARAAAPGTGTDATVEEQHSDALHRNNTPRLLPNGRVDLASFQNRYPMVKEGTCLLKKIPRRLGEPGRQVGGGIIEPEIPADVDLNTLAGLGTRVEARRDGDYLVAIVPGFLIIDTHSHQMSVTEKIVSHEGVNLRTTGNLSLDSGDFEEHGEVQENRSVEGNNMTFLGLVCGIIVSKGGKVCLKDISGGQAKSPKGSIVATGRASRAVFEVPDGEITLAHAEGCTIAGGRVKVEHAVRCQIVGDAVDIGTAEACIVAGKSVRIDCARPHRGDETVVTVLTPDSAASDKLLAQLREARAKLEAAIREKSRLALEAREQPDLKKYLLLESRVRSGELKLNDTQQMNWPRLAEKVAPHLGGLKRLLEETKALKAKHAELSQQIDASANETAQAAGNRQCAIRQVGGDTFVRAMPFPSGAAPLSADQCRQLLAHLKDAPSAGWLFSGASGEFKWKYERGARAGSDLVE